MKIIYTLIILISITLTVNAQEETKAAASNLQAEADKLKNKAADSIAWHRGGTISINGQQVSLTNWASGGQNSISVGSLVNLFLNYKKGKITWDNNVDLGYGVVKQGESKAWWKNDDRIQLTSKFGRYAFGKWYYSGLADFKTQFAEGFNYPNDSIYISKFMAPGYGLLAMGLDYKPNDKFSFFISPVTGKFTVVNDAVLARAGAFGVQKEERDLETGSIIKNYKTSRGEFGGYLKMQYRTTIMENITFATMLELFSNYLHNPQNVDVNWTTLTTMKVNKYISATLSTHLIYDDDIDITRNTGDKKGTIGPDVQFKQTLAVGLSYKF